MKGDVAITIGAQMRDFKTHAKTLFTMKEFVERFKMPKLTAK